MMGDWVKAFMRRLTGNPCWGGHEWERLGDTQEASGWWYENHRCRYCGAITQQLVAGREG